MKKLIILFLVQFSFAQKDVFEISKKGTLYQIDSVYKSNTNSFKLRDKFGFSPLIYACYKNNTEVAKYIIEKDTDLNYCSQEGTALMAVIMRNNKEIIDLLLERKVDINTTNERNETPLILSIITKNEDLALSLIERNADATIKDINNKNALDYALMYNLKKIIHKLAKN